MCLRQPLGKRLAYTQQSMTTDRSHRPHCPGHDYHNRGIYLITIVVSGREPVLGRLNMDVAHPGVLLSELGEAVAAEWERTEAIQVRKGNKVRILGKCVMPDHFHGLLFVEEAMEDSVGLIIRGFKQACNKALRTWLGYPASVPASRLASGDPIVTRSGHIYEAMMSDDERAARTVEIQRLAAQKGVHDSRLASGILFDPDYDDTILWHKGQLQAMIDYVQDNPRRAIIRRTYPDFFERCLHIWIDGMDAEGRTIRREYAAFGNLFLLRYPWKEQVMCHRWKMNGIRRDYNTPYETTDEYRQQHDALIDAAEQGAVLVTPGISKGEQLIKRECLERGLPLIHLQKEPIGEHWKPEKERFKACEAGMLLILAPWGVESLADRQRQVDDHTTVEIAADTKYSQFHNMNDLAAEICRGITDARLAKPST